MGGEERRPEDNVCCFYGLRESRVPSRWGAVARGYRRGTVFLTASMS